MYKLAKISALAMAAALMLGLSACSSSAPAPAPTSEPVSTPAPVTEKFTNEHIFEAKKKLSDGRTVICVLYTHYNQGGLTCDWANAK